MYSQFTLILLLLASLHLVAASPLANAAEKEEKAAGSSLAPSKTAARGDDMLSTMDIILALFTFVVALFVPGVDCLLRWLGKTISKLSAVFVGCFGLGSMAGVVAFHLLPVSKAFFLRTVLSWTVVVAICGYYFVSNFVRIGLKLRRGEIQWDEPQSEQLLESVQQRQTQQNVGAFLRRILNGFTSFFGTLIVNTEQQKQPSSLAVDDGGQSEGGYSVIATLAWTIANNVLGGLFIGATAASPLSSLTVFVAFLCKRPNKAVLPAKLSNKWVAILVSLITSHIGFLSGALIEVFLAPFSLVPIITYGISCTLFVYSSMRHFVPELNKEVEKGLNLSIKKALKVLSLQLLGVSSGVLFAVSTEILGG